MTADAIVNGLRLRERDVDAMDRALGVGRRWEVRDPHAALAPDHIRIVCQKVGGALVCSCNAPPVCLHTVAVQNILDAATFPPRPAA